MFRLFAFPIELATKCTAVHAQHSKDGFIAVGFKLLVVSSLRMAISRNM
jgi:hypothetical protein